MKVLALVHRVPFPPNKGEKIRAYHELAHLSSRGHEIDLATFADRPEDRRFERELRELCRDVRVVPIDPRIARVRSGLELLGTRPLSVGYFHSTRLRSAVRSWLRWRRYDVAFCYSSPMAEYVRDATEAGMVRIMDFCDVDSDKWRQYADRMKLPMRAVYRLEHRRLRAYEREIAEEFDASTVISVREAEELGRIAPAARDIRVIANGVDADRFGAVDRSRVEPHTHNIVFVGQMDYFANVDAVVWFAEEVLPRIRARLPSARFVIVGRAPVPEVTRLVSLAGVEVTGEVSDVRDRLATAQVMVAPLRIARGVQNKVLEAMAARVPVVASPAASAGIDGAGGTHLSIAPDAESFAARVLELLEEPARGQALATSARALVEERYGWRPAMERLESLMLEKLERRRARAG